MSDRKSPASHYEIFDYWKDKVITKYGKVKSFDEDISGATYITVVSDWAEARCWGCGKPAVSEKQEDAIYEKCDKENDFDYKMFWNNDKIKSKFERAHIIPKSLGGSNEPSNLFLLCPECHHYSPDTTNPANFYRWIYKRNQDFCCGKMSPPYIYKKLKEEIESRGYNLETIAKDISHKFTEKDVYAYLEKNVGSHTVTVVDSSIIMSYSDFLIDKWKAEQP